MNFKAALSSRPSFGFGFGSGLPLPPRGRTTGVVGVGAGAGAGGSRDEEPADLLVGGRCGTVVPARVRGVVRVSLPATASGVLVLPAGC